MYIFSFLLTPPQDADIRETRALTTAPFGVNLFSIPAAAKTDEAARVAAAREVLAPLLAEVGLELPPADAPLPGLPDFEEQLGVVLRHSESVPFFSYTFGCLGEADVARLHSKDIKVIGTATSVAEAIALEREGVDGIVAQVRWYVFVFNVFFTNCLKKRWEMKGAEAGGHRGSFLAESSLVGVMSLVPQMVDAVRVPVLAAGGIGDGRGVAAAVCLGAEGAAIGTALLPSSDSDAAPAHKRCVTRASESDTVVSDVSSGRAARGFLNGFVEAYAAAPASRGCSNLNSQRVLAAAANVAPYPLQQALTGPLKREALRQGKPGVPGMWCGQSPRLATTGSVAALVETLERQYFGLLPTARC